MNTRSFSTDASAEAGALEVVPVIDTVPLTDRFHDFERATGMETRAQSYGGLIPSFFRFGPAVAHFLGTADEGSADEKTPVLGCTCGEWGCWPLRVRIIVEPGVVLWLDFEQPFRPNRDYSDFGPFAFERIGYEAAVATLADAWASA